MSVSWLAQFSMREDQSIRTDVVVKTDKFSSELCYNLVLVPRSNSKKHIPFPPFMMTHICEPTHLSMSSADDQRMYAQCLRFALTKRKEVF